MSKKRLGGCWCSYCRFQSRTSWWKRALIERDIEKEKQDAFSEGEESEDEERILRKRQA